MSCSSLDFKALNAINYHYRSGNFKKVIKRLDDFPFKEKKSELLYFLEKGLTFFRLENYDDAVREFQNAKSILEQIEKKIYSYKGKVTVINPLNRDFYGEDFERSYLYYYLGLSYFKLFSRSGDRQMLFSARAEVKAWDDFFRSIKQKRKTSLYYSDIQFRILAGLIHETLGGTTELQIAKSHYQNGLREIGALKLYRNFNVNALSYGNEYFKKVKKYRKYHHGDFSSNRTSFLKSYIEQRLKVLGKNRNNLTVFLDYDVVPKKRNRRVDLGLSAFAKGDHSLGTRILSLAGDIAFKSYLYNTLNLRPSGYYLSNHPNYTYDYYQSRGFSTRGSGAFFQFAVPIVKNEVSRKRFTVKILSEDKKMIAQKEVFLTSSLGEISKVTNRDRIGHYISTTGARYMAKQALTLAASYASYQVLKQKNNQGLAGLAGLVTYFGGSALNSLSERADLRTWSSLPKEIYLSEFELEKGKYFIQVIDEGFGKMVFEKLFELRSSQQNILPISLFEI